MSSLPLWGLRASGMYVCIFFLCSMVSYLIIPEKVRTFLNILYCTVNSTQSIQFEHCIALISRGISANIELHGYSVTYSSSYSFYPYSTLSGVGTTCFPSCCDKDSAIIFTTGRLADVNPS
jgi:hypothetical protein